MTNLKLFDAMVLENTIGNNKTKKYRPSVEND